MLLSIVMIVKDEEKNLDKTLKALELITKKINAEIVILDTGSRDKTIDIARKYTERVYETEWNGDFADMRNKAISYAKSEWILVIDADEELVNCKNLIEFLSSDLHKNYNCASIEIRNIHSNDISKYTELYIVRLFRNTKDFKYEGAIHEQPKYKKPMYSNIATFNHYGYMFADEELKQRKFKRNKNLLLLELEKDQNNPYTNYQLAKTYIFYGDNQEAIYYMEKSYEIYTKNNVLPPYIYSGLASLYLELKQYQKCEDICLEYIEKDDKNIDIYYYLGNSQQNLNKLQESLNSYKRYIFLLNNYEISTQANNLCSESDTTALKDNVEIEIIKIYYYLDNFEEVVKCTKELDLKLIRNIYNIVLMSLCKLSRLEDIKKMYINTMNSKLEYNKFKLSLELVILDLKKSEKDSLYKLICHTKDNYGILNHIRLGEDISLTECNRILKEENHSYYGDIVYYAIKRKFDLIELLKGVSNFSIQNYFNYLIAYKRDSILKLYNYLIGTANSLDLEKLNIYASLSKSLLIAGSLKGEKYKKIFLMYIMYNYYYLRKLYNDKLTDEEIIKFTKNEEEIFILKLNLLQSLKKDNPIEYIKGMRVLLIDNQQYKDAIQILIEKFEKEINQNEEIMTLKLKYKSILENSLQVGNLNDAEKMILEYESIFGDEEILNIKAVYSIYTKKIEEAEKILKIACLNDRYDLDVLFNIAYLKEYLGEKEEARKFYLEILSINSDVEIKEEVNSKLESL